MTHPTVADRAAAKQAEWECTKDEAGELTHVTRDATTISGALDELKHRSALRDVIAAALWLVDHTYATSECGVTLAREGDIQDLTAAVEALRKMGGS